MLRSSAGPGATTIDGEEGARCFVFDDEETPAAAVEDFTCASPQALASMVQGLKV